MPYTNSSAIHKLHSQSKSTISQQSQHHYHGHSAKKKIEIMKTVNWYIRETVNITATTIIQSNNYKTWINWTSKLPSCSNDINIMEFRHSTNTRSTQWRMVHLITPNIRSRVSWRPNIIKSKAQSQTTKPHHLHITQISTVQKLVQAFLFRMILKEFKYSSQQSTSSMTTKSQKLDTPALQAKSEIESCNTPILLWSNHSITLSTL